MKKKDGTQAAPQPKQRVKSTRSQRKMQVLLLLAVLLVIAGIWVIRIPKNYVNMFLDHYDGTTSVISEMKGIERSETEEAQLLPLQQAFDDWKESHLRDEAEVTAADGVTLRGGLYDAGSDVTVILLHTFDGSSADSDYLFAPYYAARGYNILLPDSRDHGESGGEHVTYGLYEGGDVACWVEWLLEKYGGGHQVILQGDTLGANAALAGAAAVEADPALAGSVRFVVAESPVVNLYDAAGYLLRNQFKIPGFMVAISDLFARNSLEGRSMKSVDLAEMTQGCEVPLLVLQGDLDTVIDPAPAAAYCDSYAGESVLVSASCAHGMVFAADPEGCEEALDRLIAAYID